MAKKVDSDGTLLKFNRIKPLTNILLNLLFIVLIAITVIPLLLILSMSLSSEASIREFGYQMIPREFSSDGYAFLLQQSALILRSLGYSLFVTVTGTIIGVLLTSSLGYVLSRPQYRLRKTLSWMVFIPMIFNGGMVGSYFVVSNLLGLKDSMWAIILTLCVTSFNVIISRTFFKLTIPDALIESAKIDGAAQLRVFFNIVLPISLPVLATIGLFLCFAYWNDWLQSMLYIDDQNLNTLQSLLNRVMGEIEYLARNANIMGASVAQIRSSLPKESARMAIAVVIVIPIACAYPFFQKYFISGLTVGAVKG